MVKMFEIKLSQGAKPGKGGILPGDKVSEEIAEIRGIHVGEDAISPNRHHDVACNDDLLNMIHRIREVTGKPVGFKVVIGGSGWFDELFSDINERGIEYAPDFITLDGAEGGTGAAPMPLIDAWGSLYGKALYAGGQAQPVWLRDRIKVVASGKLITPADVAWALCVGADFIVSARGFMFALGCIQALQCDKNSCPTGITTHNPDLQKGLVPEVKAERVASYIKNMVYEVGVLAHSCGVHSAHQLRRRHARLVLADGPSIAMDERNPPVKNAVAEESGD